MKKKKIIISMISIMIVVGVIVGIVFLFNRNKQYEIEKITEFRYYTLMQNGKAGIIDNQGNILIEPQYTTIKIPNPSKAVFVCYYNYNNNTGEYESKVLNDKNEELFTQYEEVAPIQIKEIVSEIPYEKSVLRVKKDGKYGLINFDGKVVVKPIYEELDNPSYKEGEFLVKKQDKYGIINYKGQIIVPIKYDSVSGDKYYSKEKSYQIGGYIVGNKKEEGFRYGYISYTGKRILNLQYNKIYRMTEMKEDEAIYLVAEKEGQAGLLKNKKEILPYEYTSIHYDDLNQVLIVQKNNKYGVRNIEGKEIVPTEYESIVIEGIYIYAEKNNEPVIFDMQGNEKQNLKYKNVMPTEKEQYHITIDEDNKYGVENKEGQTVLPNKYSYIEYAYQDFFIVGGENGKSGVINARNELVLNLDYDVVQKIEQSNLIQTIQDNTVELYDNNMNKMISVLNGKLYERENYIEIYSSEETKYFSYEGKQLASTQVFPNHTLFAKKEADKWGFSDKQGQIKIPAKYDKVTEFNEYGFAGIKVKDKWGVIKEDGTVVLEPTYSLKDKTGEPSFIGKYYKVVAGYGEAYYTDETEETE